MKYDFEAIKARIDIEVLFREDGHALTQANGRLRCLSPFNQERTPSCYVDPARQRFKCFSSGHSGDVFDYVMLSRHCTPPEAYAFLAAKAGVTVQGDGKSLPPPAPRKPAPQAKPITQLQGRELETWNEGVAFLAESLAARQQIAAWRGFSVHAVDELVSAGLLAIPRLPDWARDFDLDREPGARRTAMPVHGMIDGSSALLGYHMRLKKKPGDRRAKWLFVPKGIGAWPYILGDIATARLILICEGQWDAMALFDALAVPYSALSHEGIAIAGLRGAANWRLFTGHYLARDGGATAPTAVVVCDADAAGATWTTPDRAGSCLVNILKKHCSVVSVLKPAAAKDVNDVWRAITSASPPTPAALPS